MPSRRDCRFFRARARVRRVPPVHAAVGRSNACAQHPSTAHMRRWTLQVDASVEGGRVGQNVPEIGGRYARI